MLFMPNYQSFFEMRNDMKFYWESSLDSLYFFLLLNDTVLRFEQLKKHSANRTLERFLS